MHFRNYIPSNVIASGRLGVSIEKMGFLQISVAYID